MENNEKSFEVKISGYGTREQIAESLREIAKSVESGLSGDLEDPFLHATIEELFRKP
jgi:undecaprenyl pyrophosphate synthase